jgi:hypothetical protein
MLLAPRTWPAKEGDGMNTPLMLVILFVVGLAVMGLLAGFVYACERV